MELLRNVAGRRVLDAACGPGLYAEALLARGTQVIGFDQSPRMIDLCRQRVPSGEFRVHDLARPLDWMPDSSVDLVLLPLAIEYIDDRIAALRELHRVLRPTGALVVGRTAPGANGRRDRLRALSTSVPRADSFLALRAVPRCRPSDLLQRIEFIQNFADEDGARVEPVEIGLPPATREALDVRSVVPFEAKETTRRR